VKDGGAARSGLVTRSEQLLAATLVTRSEQLLAAKAEQLGGTRWWERLPPTTTLVCILEYGRERCAAARVS
jgi:hypothetical protein